MAGEFSYPYDWQAEQDFADSNVVSLETFKSAREPLDIASILLDYFKSEQMAWADRPEAVKTLLGEQAEAVGNLLLNSPKPLALTELARLADLSTLEADQACRKVTLLMPEPAPLEFVATADRETNVSRYQIISIPPRNAA